MRAVNREERIYRCTFGSLLHHTADGFHQRIAVTALTGKISRELVPIPIIHIVFFNAEALRTQRIAEKKAIDSAVLRDLRVLALRTIKTKTQCLFWVWQ